MSMDFDPNAAKAKLPWATYVPNRSPKFKMHKQRGHALSANYYNNYILYKWDSNTDRWEEVYRLEDWTPPTKDSDTRCDQCGGSLPTYGEYYAKDSAYYQMQHYKDRILYHHEWARKNDKIVDPPRMVTLCQTCHNANRGY